MMCEVWLLKSNANETDKEVTFVYVYGRWLKRLKVSVGADMHEIINYFLKRVSWAHTSVLSKDIS